MCSVSNCSTYDWVFYCLNRHIWNVIESILALKTMELAGKSDETHITNTTHEIVSCLYAAIMNKIAPSICVLPSCRSMWKFQTHQSYCLVHQFCHFSLQPGSLNLCMDTAKTTIVTALVPLLVLETDFAWLRNKDRFASTVVLQLTGSDCFFHLY